MASATASQPDNKEVMLNISGLQGPCRVRYRLAEQAKVQWLKSDLPGQAGSTTRIQLPRGQEHIVEVYQTYPFWEYRGQSERVMPLDNTVPVLVSFRIRWETVVPVLLLMGGLGLLVWRRKDSPALPIDSQEPLIRSDGKVPSRPVGRYRLTQVLGSGGMGVVYKAEGPDGIPVAIKVPAPHLIAQDDYRKRFFREIELGTRLRHPRVVEVLEMPTEAEIYVVMEFVDGKPLDALPRGPWASELKQVLLWAEQALEALEFIHSKGVIHRDLKPSNLMIQPDQSLKLMDFGIAHSVHGTRLTGTDHILGTPVYMAPEQLRGSQIDPRADLYSLGVILYERLLGGLPFPEDLMELMRHKLHQPLAPLSQAGCPVAPEVDDFVNRLVAHDPQQRFQNASAALAAVRKLLGR